MFCVIWKDATGSIGAGEAWYWTMSMMNGSCHVMLRFVLDDRA